MNSKNEKAANNAAQDNKVDNTQKADENRLKAILIENTDQAVSPELSSNEPDDDNIRRIALDHCADAIMLTLMNSDVGPLKALLEHTVEKLHTYVLQLEKNAGLVDEMSPIGNTLPATEGHARELADVDNENRLKALLIENADQTVSPELSSNEPDDAFFDRRLALVHCADAIGLTLINYDAGPLSSLLEHTMDTLHTYILQLDKDAGLLD